MPMPDLRFPYQAIGCLDQSVSGPLPIPDRPGDLPVVQDSHDLVPAPIRAELLEELLHLVTLLGAALSAPVFGVSTWL